MNIFKVYIKYWSSHKRRNYLKITRKCNFCGRIRSLGGVYLKLSYRIRAKWWKKRERIVFGENGGGGHVLWMGLSYGRLPCIRLDPSVVTSSNDE